jgi:hypothetical protein
MKEKKLIQKLAFVCCF